MTNSHSCSIRLLNKTYEIKCPEGEETNLMRAAEKLNEQLIAQKNKAKNQDEFHRLLLAALHISHELIVSERLQEHQRLQVTQFINALENKNQPVANYTSDIDPQTD